SGIVFPSMEDGVIRMLGFSAAELDMIVRACALIQIDECTPPYRQSFISQLGRDRSAPGQEGPSPPIGRDGRTLHTNQRTPRQDWMTSRPRAGKRFHAMATPTSTS